MCITLLYRLVGKFNHSHSVADIKQYIIEYPYICILYYMYIRTGCLFLDTSSFMSNYYKVFMCVVVF